MLDDISEILNGQKRSDLVARLNNRRVEQSLPAEMELASIWMLKNLGEIEIEPLCSDGRKPDIYVHRLVNDLPGVVEVAAISDNSVSGENAMDHCARELSSAAEDIQTGLGQFLYFTFYESITVERGRAVRNIAAPREYRLSDRAAREIRLWLEADPTPDHLCLEDNGLSVRIEKRPCSLARFYNFHTSRPPRIYSNTDNPIFKTLSKKLRQIEGANDGTLRIILLTDGGSRTLAELANRARPFSAERYSTAKDIISHFIRDKRGRVDAVVVLLPVVKTFPPAASECRWEVVVFAEEPCLTAALKEKFSSAAKILPVPRCDGTTARSLSRQNSTRQSLKYGYLGRSLTWKGNEMRYRISSRLFKEFLASRIDERRFRQLLGEGEGGLSFENFLKSGWIIRSIDFESGGIDKDDDYIVFEFVQDVSETSFR